MNFTARADVDEPTDLLESYIVASWSRCDKYMSLLPLYNFFPTVLLIGHLQSF